MPDQPELRQRLAEALREHWFVPSAGKCRCGSSEAMPFHLSDVLLALPGIAITALPDGIPGGFGDFFPNEVCATLTGRVVCDLDDLSPAYARELAASLLAAAGVAEEQTNA